MDIQETISRVRKEYKDYLREKHPDWAESSLSTHVSDAFYLWLVNEARRRILDGTFSAWKPGMVVKLSQRL